LEKENCCERMVKQNGGSLFTDDFLENSDLPQFHRILFSTSDEAKGVAAPFRSEAMPRRYQRQ
jgi:hypothetical protein